MSEFGVAKQPASWRVQRRRRRSHDSQSETQPPGKQIPKGWSAAFIPQVMFLHVVQLSGLAAALYFALVHPQRPAWWLLALLSYFLSTCLGMAICFHRAIAHRAFSLPKPLEYAFTVFGALGGTGSSIAWVAVHRTHHAHPDSDDDPHAPGRFGWRLLLSVYEQDQDWWRVRDLFRNRFHWFLHRYYALIILLWVGALAAVDFRAMLFGFLIPAAAQISVTNLSTILGHRYGYRNFETRDESTNSVLLTVLTWGEGWHNNHHARPRKWFFGTRWWEVDLAGLIIRSFIALGLVDHRSVVED